MDADRLLWGIINQIMENASLDEGRQQTYGRHGDLTPCKFAFRIQIIPATRMTGQLHLNHPKADMMIEITMTETAKSELLKVLGNVSAKSIRLINQGFG